MDFKLVKELIVEYSEFKIAISKSDLEHFPCLYEMAYVDWLSDFGYFIYEIRSKPWAAENSLSKTYRRCPIEDMEKVLRKARKLRNFK